MAKLPNPFAALIAQVIPTTTPQPAADKAPKHSSAAIGAMVATLAGNTDLSAQRASHLRGQTRHRKTELPPHSYTTSEFDLAVYQVCERSTPDTQPKPHGIYNLQYAELKPLFYLWAASANFDTKYAAYQGDIKRTLLRGDPSIYMQDKPIIAIRVGKGTQRGKVLGYITSSPNPT